MTHLDMLKMPSQGFVMPAGLNLEDQLMFAIGRLVSEWAICESLVWGLFQSLTSTQRESMGPAVLWLSTRGTGARVTLVERLASASELPSPLLKEIKDALAKFNELTRVRNFFCHAWYAADQSTLELKVIESHRLKGDSVVVEREDFTPATVDKAVRAINDVAGINPELWRLVHDVRVELGLPNGSYVLQHAGA